MPLHMAPSTFGETQKSPQIANRLFPNHKHFSSPATLAAGNALPLRKRKKKKNIHTWKVLFLLLSQPWNFYIFGDAFICYVRILFLSTRDDTNHLWAFLKNGSEILSPVLSNSWNSSSATFANAAFEGFSSPISEIIRCAYFAVECSTQRSLHKNSGNFKMNNFRTSG